MAVFAYKAMDGSSAAVNGTIVADTARQARDLLRQRGLVITEVRKPAWQGRKWFSVGHGMKAQSEVVGFVRELATLLTAGIPLLSALQTLQGQHSPGFTLVLQFLSDRIAAGEGLAQAMRQQSDYFDELCVSIVQVGENTGSLEVALRRLADFKDKSVRLKSKVTTAMVYPTVVLVLGVSVSIFLMTHVVPNLLATLIQAGKPLPTVTRFVKACSDLILNWWWLLLILFGLAVAGVRTLLAKEKGRVFVDRKLLKVPVLGDLIRKENTCRVAVVLAALLRSGLPFIQALQITRRTITNRVFQSCLEGYESAVAAGSDVSKPLAESQVFSPMVVQMLAVGQESGQLEEMLEQLAASQDQEVQVATARLTALLEPLLIVLLAVLVGFIAFATILPILEAGNVL